MSPNVQTGKSKYEEEESKMFLELKMEEVAAVGTHETKNV